MRILLVDDLSDAEATTRAINLRMTCDVRAIESADAMIPVVRDFTPDVILSNHSPPRFNALEAVRAAQRVSPDVPLIVLMETLDPEAIADCLRSGAVDVVGKLKLVRVGPAMLGALGLRQLREAKARAETTLRDSEERFRLLADNLPGVVYLRRNDEQYSMVYLNDAVETLTGYSREAFLDGSITFAGLCHPEDSAACDAAVDRAVACRLPFHLVYRLRHRSGGWRWVDERGVGVYRDGELKYVEGFLSEAVITADGCGRIDSMNPAAATNAPTRSYSPSHLSTWVNGHLVDLRLAMLSVGSRIAGWWQESRSWARSLGHPRRRILRTSFNGH